jgi:hypothetical protein
MDFDTFVMSSRVDWGIGPPKYTTLTAILEIFCKGKRNTYSFDILYNHDTRLFYDMNDADWEWQEGCRGYRNDEVHVWLPDECQTYQGLDLLFLLMSDYKLTPSMAGKRMIIQQFENGISDLDNDLDNIPLYDSDEEEKENDEENDEENEEENE